MTAGKHILVTGGSGYIGSHACKVLAQAGYNPIAYDNLVYGREWAVKWWPLEKGDINDRSRLDGVIENTSQLLDMICPDVYRSNTEEQSKP